MDQTNSVPAEQIDQPIGNVDTASEKETSTVDFSDEDAALAAQAPEFQLEDSECDEPDSTEENQLDFSGQSRCQINDEFARILTDEPIQRIRKTVEAMKIAFYKAYRAEVEAARKEFIDNGGNPDEFIKSADEEETRFKTLFAQYRDKRDAVLHEIENSKEDNLKAKLQIIDELKELVNSTETVNHTFNQFRELQRRWKETGLVPQANVKDLWETYHLHVENFYNFVKINNELRDLDLKKNYETKIALCEEAEQLSLESSIIEAFHKLQKLHDQWREAGPVANEYKDQLWERFRAASAVINKRHQDHFDKIKEEQKRNLDLKTELCRKIAEISATPYASRKEWNAASDELINVQQVWKTIGFAPKKENTKIYEQFRELCDAFFEKKRGFYSEVKSELDNNYQAKIDICVQAEALQNSEDWKKTTDQLIALQKKWKEVGPTSRKNSDAVWKRFRTACDAFFNRKSQHFGNIDKQYDENLTAKQQLLNEIRAYEITDREAGFEQVKAFQRRWSEIGFVPVRDKDRIQKEYKELIDNLFTALRGGERDRRLENFREKVQRTDNDRSLRYERDRLYNKVRQTEADIQLLENNIGFFAKSKNADAMIREVELKIQKAKEEMAVLIEKIKMIDSKQE